MSAPAVKSRVSVADYVAFAQRQERGRYELIGGEIVAMAPERAEHVRAKSLIWRAFADSIAKCGLPCEAFVDGLAVVIDAETAYEPDVVVNCGAPVARDSLVAPAPVVVVEVISPSSQNMDKTIKLSGYFKLASLTHYLVVDLAGRTLYHYKREDDGLIRVRFIKDGNIDLVPPGLKLDIGAFFL